TRYKVHRGDTVQSVADNVGVPPAMIRQWNRLRSDSLAGRKVLLVRLPVTPNSRETRVASAKATKTKSKKSTQTAQTPEEKNAVVRHKVKQGETLYSIATSYKTTVDAIKRDNRNVATLRPGMIILIREVR
ncbi:MAG: hypothetical protein DMG71_20635, partial [Acidobacteria bacterium]